LILNDLAATPVLLLFAIPIAYVLLLFVGLPAALLALRLRKVQLGAALTVGAGIGLVMGLLVARGFTPQTVALYVYCGLVVSGTFWGVFRRLSAGAEP
jgi:uncharacterized membrane protein